MCYTNQLALPRKCGIAKHFTAVCKVKRGHVKVVNNVAEAEREQYEDLCSITPESVNKVPKSLDRQSSQLFAVCCSETIWSNSSWIVGQRVTSSPQIL